MNPEHAGPEGSTPLSGGSHAPSPEQLYQWSLQGEPEYAFRGTLGFLLVAAGIAGVTFAMAMDTRSPGDEALRTHLLQQQLLWVLISLTSVLCGTIVAATGRVR